MQFCFELYEIWIDIDILINWATLAAVIGLPTMIWYQGPLVVFAVVLVIGSCIFCIKVTLSHFLKPKHGHRKSLQGRKR